MKHQSHCENLYGADSLAHVLFCIYKAIEIWPQGTANASYTLEHWIWLAYRHTEAHQAGFQLYKLPLAGDLSTNNEPSQLISAVAERGETERIKRTPKKNVAIGGRRKLIHEARKADDANTIGPDYQHGVPTVHTRNGRLAPHLIFVEVQS
jgi:hypothetical protein